MTKLRALLAAAAICIFALGILVGAHVTAGTNHRHLVYCDGAGMACWYGNQADGRRNLSWVSRDSPLNLKMPPTFTPDCEVLDD